MRLGDYECKTTFWTDFTIAELFGDRAVRDTYRRAFDEWQTDVVYMTELVMVLNWKMWAYAETNPDLSRLYQELWSAANDYCWDFFKGEDQRYFYETTD